MPDRIEVANAILRTFVPVTLSRRKGRLRMKWTSMPGTKYERTCDCAVLLDSAGKWLKGKLVHSHFPGGGTSQQMLAQLIRYVRDLPRYPVCVWNLWCSPHINAADTECLRLLEASDYGERTACVLCGTHEYKGGIDWWSLGKVEGPCCFAGRCRKEKG